MVKRVRKPRKRKDGVWQRYWYVISQRFKNPELGPGEWWRKKRRDIQATLPYQPPEIEETEQRRQRLIARKKGEELKQLIRVATAEEFKKRKVGEELLKEQRRIKAIEKARLGEEKAKTKILEDIKKQEKIALEKYSILQKEMKEQNIAARKLDRVIRFSDPSEEKREQAREQANIERRQRIKAEEELIDAYNSLKRLPGENKEDFRIRKELLGQRIFG